MEESKIVINAAPGVSEIIVREGQALAQTQPPKKISVSGMLSAPFDYLAGKSCDVPTTTLYIKKDVGLLDLHINEPSVESEVIITGKLSNDNVLSQFKINTENRWSFKEFAKFIQMKAYYFDTPSVVPDMIKSLRTFEGKLQVAFKQQNSNDGNSLSHIETTVDGFQIERKFKLNIPVYQGYPKEKFFVEIGFDPSSTGVSIFLISDELFALEINLRERIVSDELAKFSTQSFSKVTLS